MSSDGPFVAFSCPDYYDPPKMLGVFGTVEDAKAAVEECGGPGYVCDSAGQQVLSYVVKREPLPKADIESDWEEIESRLGEGISGGLPAHSVVVGLEWKTGAWQ